MGFYGNITNTSNTTFQFDRIYPNRLTMDANVNSDGIFIGRYVLIEYQEDAAYPIIYINNNKFYSSPNHEETTRIKFIEDKTAENKNGFCKDEIAQTTVNDKLVFYICTGGIDGYADFSPVEVSNRSNYVANFNIDEAHYGVEKGFKGYDSTVWTKVSEKNKEGKLITKYVNIADLNSVVPTFDIAADAPSMKPLTPHFDTDSTNVYYRLHTQPQWGFRVAQANGKTTLSDVTTEWKTADYIPETDSKIIKYGTGVENGVTRWSNQAAEIDAAIYYNADGFKKQLMGTDERGETINKHSKITQNIINIMPTGKSGNEYETHDGTKGKAVQEDIQELTIQLPSIGNMMSDAWDIIHGPNRDNYRGDGQNASLQGKLDSFDAFYDNQIPVKRTNNGKIVGSRINGAANYDNNATWTSETKPKEVLYDDSNPNFNRDDAWIKTEVFTADLKDGDKNTANDQGGNSGISIHHTFHATANSTSYVDKNIDNGNIKTDAAYKSDKIQSNNLLNIDNKKDFIELYTPYVDAKGHVVGKNIETITLPYGYKTFTTNGRYNADNDVNTEEFDNSNNASIIRSSIVADSTQDALALNSGNEWIRIDTDANNDIMTFSHDIHYIEESDIEPTDLNELQGNQITVQDTIYDAAGHVTHNQHHTYTLPYGFKTINVQNNDDDNSGAPVQTGIKGETADNTQDSLTFEATNKWIKMAAVGEDKENKIIFGHELSDVITTDKETTDLNAEATRADSIIIPDWSYDTAGHITSKQKHEYILPYGYKSFTDGTNVSTANSTQDGFNLVGDNWLQPIVSDNTITYNHIGPVKPEMVNDKNNITDPQFGSTFTIEDWHFDNKGHMHTSGKTHTVQFPKGSIEHPTTTSNTNEVITSLSFVPESGKISYQKDNSSTLKLTADYTNNGIGAGNIAGGDTINTAFAKLEKQVIQEVSDRDTAIKTAIANLVDSAPENINTLGEIVAWLDNDGDEKIDIIKDIASNTSKIDEEIGRATAAEQGLQERIEALGTAAKENKEYFATAAQGSTADTTAATIATYGDIVTYDAEDFVSKAEYNALLSDYNELRELVEKLNNQINPPQEPDNGGEIV